MTVAINTKPTYAETDVPKYNISVNDPKLLPINASISIPATIHLKLRCSCFIKAFATDQQIGEHVV